MGRWGDGGRVGCRRGRKRVSAGRVHGRELVTRGSYAGRGRAPR
ncbi:hypothetical protein STXM2123_3235 [Streptomyces sp. F-3]|nr:hypothetical protein STXM2123_3235 [Streptomyces sp. F-3]